MEAEETIEHVAIVGAGLIGSSWAAHYLACGLDVTVTDPAPQAERELRAFVARVWPALIQIGLVPGASPDRLRFVSTLREAVTKAQFVQENGPEREAYKVRIFSELDALTSPEVILASSSSGLTMSVIQRECRCPDRCVIGHPFNPPHLIPLVEIVGGRDTSLETIERAEKFYAKMRKRTIRLNREVPGHVANRLQAALWREAVYLVSKGVVSVSDVDAAVSWGPGLRWGVMGPNLILHLGGGAGGMEHFMKHLSGPFTQWWEDLGQPVLTPELQAQLIEGVQFEANGRTIEELATYRDKIILNILALRKQEEEAIIKNGSRDV